MLFSSKVVVVSGMGLFGVRSLRLLSFLKYDGVKNARNLKIGILVIVVVLDMRKLYIW